MLEINSKLKSYPYSYFEDGPSRISLTAAISGNIGQTG